MPNVDLKSKKDQSLEVQPLSDEELDAAFSFMLSAIEGEQKCLTDRADVWGDPVPLLLAVSGGADSLSLMVLCDEWMKRNKIPLTLHVASVDHGLRPEAAEECSYVKSLAEERGLTHVTLVWGGEKSHSNLQGEARVARYRLMADYAQSIGCRHIAIAHHQDDQAETLLMRLIRGSGVTGLAAMRPMQPFGAVSLVRPLMAFPKARLKASLVARSLRWVEDPSNQSRDYTRVRVRSLLPIFSSEGCEPSRLAATARRLQRADAALTAIASDFFKAQVTNGPGRSVSVRLEPLVAETEEIRLRVLRLMLVRVAGPGYPPREERLMALDAALRESKESEAPLKRTIGGCCFEGRKGTLWVYRETGRERADVILDGEGNVNWQALYSVRIVRAGDTSGEVLEKAIFTVRPLGEDGRVLLAKEGMIFMKEDRSCEILPKGVIEALPSVWLNERPCWVADWPKVDLSREFDVEFEEKHIDSTANETLE